MIFHIQAFQRTVISAIKIVLSFTFCLGSFSVSAQQTDIRYLSGKGKDHTVEWDFYVTKGNNSGKWSKIQVPSNWELQGFGTYNYGKIKAENQSDEQGLYKHNFQVDQSWKGKKVNIVFEGSMTDTEVKINGKLAGKVHQGSFYRFRYDISSLLKFDSTNLLEVKVSKNSANESVNNAEREADYWIFGGIFRPVYLEILPQTYIDHIAIDAKANGAFLMNVFTKNLSADSKIDAVIKSSSGNKKFKKLISDIQPSDTLVVLKETFEGVDLWSSEFPHMYTVEVNLRNNNGQIIHTVNKKFGFRTVELRPKDGFYLNNQKVLFKGVNRHSFWPSSGRTTSKQLSIEDVEMMKDMNMNAVRMSHYPPDEHFLDVCDSLGLLVLDEIAGWQQHYDDTTGHRIVKQIVERDVNHPSIVIWDNGNEGGFNFNLDDDYAKYDPQKRIVIHPWAKFKGTDTKHYPVFNYLQNSVLYDNDIYFPTEFLHGLYDGGHAAGLDDFWDLMRKHPNGAGGFLWVFADEAVERKDKKDSLDASGNEAPDGIVGPYHEKEGSYFTIKEIWSPVYIEQRKMTSDFKGKLKIENRFMFTNLSQCKFSWKLVSYFKSNALEKTLDASGEAVKLALEPGGTGFLNLNLPTSWKNSDVLFLTATDPHSKEIFTWSWPIKTAKEMSVRWQAPHNAQAVSASEEGNLLKVNFGTVSVYFEKSTGYLQKVVKDRKQLTLTDGPALAGFDQTMTSFKHQQSGNDYSVHVIYNGKDTKLEAKWTFSPDRPVKLSYTYSQKGEADYLGVTFNYPEDKIIGMKWLGRGPYHVWKNRLKGQQFDLWNKSYNTSVTGEKYGGYPEFKGNHAQVYRVDISTKEFPFKVFSENDDMFLQMLKTEDPKGAFNKNTTVNYPKGNIGFMDYIQPIGTKFTRTQDLGPQSQKNMMLNNKPISNTLWFDFR